MFLVHLIQKGKAGHHAASARMAIISDARRSGLAPLRRNPLGVSCA
jgi:hypothetical protein